MAGIIGSVRRGAADSGTGGVHGDEREGDRAGGRGNEGEGGGGEDGGISVVAGIIGSVRRGAADSGAGGGPTNTPEVTARLNPRTGRSGMTTTLTSSPMADHHTSQMA